MYYDDLDLQITLEDLSYNSDIQRELHFENAREDLEQLFGEWEGE